MLAEVAINNEAKKDINVSEQQKSYPAKEIDAIDVNYRRKLSEKPRDFQEQRKAEGDANSPWRENKKNHLRMEGSNGENGGLLRKVYLEIIISAESEVSWRVNCFNINFVLYADTML